MKVSIFIQRENKKLDILFNGKTAGELLYEIKINPTTVVITRNKEIITEDTPLKNKDSLELLSVISGG